MPGCPGSIHSLTQQILHGAQYLPGSVLGAGSLTVNRSQSPCLVRGAVILWGRDEQSSKQIKFRE